MPRHFSDLTEGKGGQLVKYGIVTVINVVISQAVLYFANTQMGLSGGWASVVSAVVGMVPAYFLSRYWVWEKSGAHSVRGELLPFFAIAILGLVVSASFAELADRSFGPGLAVNAGNLLGYFLVWVAKFFLLDRLFDPATEASDRAVDHTVVDSP